MMVEEAPSISMLILVNVIVILILIVVVVARFEPMGRMSVAESADMVLERPLVLEIGPADAEPELPTVLLVGAPVSSNRKGLPALVAHERLGAVLALVVSLEGAEVLERLRPRVVDVVLAALSAAVAWHSKHGRRWQGSSK